MDAKEIALKTAALVVLVVAAAGLLVIAPAGIRLFIALLALPLETIILVALLGGENRRVPLR